MTPEDLNKAIDKMLRHRKWRGLLITCLQAILRAPMQGEPGAVPLKKRYALAKLEVFRQMMPWTAFTVPERVVWEWWQHYGQEMAERLQKLALAGQVVEFCYYLPHAKVPLMIDELLQREKEQNMLPDFAEVQMGVRLSWVQQKH